MLRNRGGFPRRNGTVMVPVKLVQAKHPSNQDAVDRLVEMRINAEKNPNSNFVFTVKRAIKSLAECKTPITTLAEANALKYVGPRLAKVILPDGGEPEQPKVAKKPPPAAKGSDPKQQRSSNLPTAKPRKATATIKENGPSSKERAYEKAKLDAENLQLPRFPWKVILLIDGREAKSKHVVSKCRQSGIPCEERHLPIGDMAWIARCEKEDKTTVEVLCGTIIERKEVSDLASSLFGTRYVEQRLRLQQSGIPQVLFLVEGNLNHCPNCPADSLHMAMVETRVQLGFQVIHTQHLEETVRVLKGLHRQVVRRTFPTAFSADLPTFASPQQATRQKRRRPTSLLEMVFDTPPVPPLNTKRFITYDELKAKVLFDREAGTRSVKAIYMAMLKQVATLSNKKCEGIAREYPTLNSLLTAFVQSSGPRRMVQDVTCDRQRIGPKSADELYIACCTQRDGSVLGHEYLAGSSSTLARSYIPLTGVVSRQATSCPPPEPLASRTGETGVAAAQSIVEERPIIAKPPLVAPRNPRASNSARVELSVSDAPNSCVDLTADTPEKANHSVPNSPQVSTRTTLSFSSPNPPVGLPPLTVQPQARASSSLSCSQQRKEPSKTHSSTLPMDFSESSTSDTMFKSPESVKPNPTHLQPQVSGTRTSLSKSSDSSESAWLYDEQMGCEIRLSEPPKLSQESALSDDASFASPECKPPASNVARAKAVTKPVATLAKTPASASSSSYGCFTSPDDTTIGKPPARMVSLESEPSVTSAQLSTQCSTKQSYRVNKPAPFYDTSPMLSEPSFQSPLSRHVASKKPSGFGDPSPMYSMASSSQSSNILKPHLAKRTDSVSIDLSLDDSDDDELDAILRERQTKRCKSDVIEID